LIPLLFRFLIGRKCNIPFTVLPENLLRADASHLAQRFGLPGLPALLPEECPATDLQRAACIRAFLGRPTLVVLEHPIKFQDSGILEPMTNAIQQVRRRQGAVVWFTEHESVVADLCLPASRRYRISGGQLLDLEQPA
jgi:phospholipid/cholesterol/gamma-HCH transport system ATP-binding protein